MVLYILGRCKVFLPCELSNVIARQTPSGVWGFSPVMNSKMALQMLNLRRFLHTVSKQMVSFQFLLFNVTANLMNGKATLHGVSHQCEPLNCPAGLLKSETILNTGAAVWFFASVNFHMLFQFIGSSKWPWALWAAVGFFSSVNSQMSFQKIRRSKRLWTYWTSEGFFSSMYFQMMA